MPIAESEISKICLFAAQGAAGAVCAAGLRPTGEFEADTVGLEVNASSVSDDSKKRLWLSVS